MANCIKCGKELSNTRVFCTECLEVMEAYPVPSGTPVNIPQRQEAVKKTASKKKLSPEEQVPRLRRLVAWLAGIGLVLAVFLGVALFLLVREFQEPDYKPEETKGQNYSTQGSVPPAST